MDFSGLIDLFGEYSNLGIGGLIAMGVSILLWILERTFGIPKIIMKLFYTILDAFLKEKIKNLNEINIIKETDVLNHDLFNYIDFWTYNKVPTIQFSTEYRTVIFRKYLKILLQKHKVNLQTWIQSKNFEEMDNSKLWSSVLEVINSIVEDYEEEMKNVGIPVVIIDKMKVRNNDTISLTIDLLESICNSQFYDSDKNLLKVYSILNILLCVLEYTISSSERVCNSINGQLSGMSMDGKVEP